MNDVTMSNNQRTITAFFDDRESAETAMNQLTGFGIPADRIRLVEGSQNSDT